MRLLFMTLVFAVGFAGTVNAQSPDVADVLSAIRAAYDQVSADDASTPRANLATRLEHLGDVDQVGRLAFQRIDLSRLSAPDAKAARDAAWREIGAHDIANQAELKRLLPPSGWFLRSAVGPRAERAAFLVVQHAVNDPALMRDVLQRMEPAVATGEADGPSWAEMYDRVALDIDHRPQRYGTQVWCRHGEPWSLRDLEDSQHVDERRASVGIQQSEAAYMSQFSGLCPR